MIYDRTETGRRLKERRKELHMSANDVAQKINKAPRYYWDIERGACGMSVETLIDLARCLDLSLDYILFGAMEEEGESDSKTAYHLLSRCSSQTQKDAVVLLKTFLNISEGSLQR